jgi:bis(5'-adenosyl)-triphosphatase
VHVHILPRRFKGDKFENANDSIYPAIEESEKNLPHYLLGQKAASTEVETFKVDADEDRKPRTLEEMESEANWLRSYFTA